MSTSWKLFLVALCSCVFFSSCGRSKVGPRKAVYPLKGTVYVDGKPEGMLAVLCQNVQGMDSKMPTVSEGMTKEDGTFEITTYDQGDGVPEGEYILTFKWGKLDLLHGGYGGPDKLKGKYSNPKQSKHRVKVEKGKPGDAGKIELTTK